VKILVRGTNWIGDAVMSVPAMRELRRIFPDARITLHTRSWADGLFADAEFIDELVTYDPHKWKVKDVVDNSDFLKRDGYDLAVMLPNSFESALTAFLSRVPRRIGYNKDLRGLLLTDPIAVPEWKNRKHEVFYYLNLVSEVEKRILGRDTVGRAVPNIDIEVSGERLGRAREWLMSRGVDTSRKIVGLGVGSTNSDAKRWPAERFTRLNDLLAADGDVQVVLLGSGAEREIAERVSADAIVKPVNLAGETDLAEAVAVLAAIDLLVSNDMGLAHIAPAVGTDTAVIFGPTNPETTRPFSPRSVLIREEVECSPCMLRQCPIDHRCMTRISPERVHETVREMLVPSVPDIEVYSDQPIG
jgi:heptosyltransferase-2